MVGDNKYRIGIMPNREPSRHMVNHSLPASRISSQFDRNRWSGISSYHSSNRYWNARGSWCPGIDQTAWSFCLGRSTQTCCFLPHLKLHTIQCGPSVIMCHFCWMASSCWISSRRPDDIPSGVHKIAGDIHEMRHSFQDWDPQET